MRNNGYSQSLFFFVTNLILLIASATWYYLDVIQDYASENVQFSIFFFMILFLLWFTQWIFLFIRKSIDFSTVAAWTSAASAIVIPIYHVTMISNSLTSFEISISVMLVLYALISLMIIKLFPFGMFVAEKVLPQLEEARDILTTLKTNIYFHLKAYSIQDVGAELEKLIEDLDVKINNVKGKQKLTRTYARELQKYSQNLDRNLKRILSKMKISLEQEIRKHMDSIETNEKELSVLLPKFFTTEECSLLDSLDIQ